MASDSTPLRGWPYPAESDAPDVAADLESLAVALDTCPIVTQGTLADRPAAAVAGNRYYVTGDSTPLNNGVEYIDTGSAWVVLPHQPVGSGAVWYAGSDPVDHDGVTRWMICNGRAISRTTYAALYAAITTTWGTGDGSTTFNIPDLRGRVPVGVDTGGVHMAVAEPALASSGGEEQHTLTVAELADHNHGYGGHVPVTTGVWSYVLGSAASGSLGAPLFNQPGTLADFTGTSGNGSSDAHNNVQPYLAVNHIIRVL